MYNKWLAADHCQRLCYVEEFMEQSACAGRKLIVIMKVFVANHLGTVSKRDEQELPLLPSFWRRMLAAQRMMTTHAAASGQLCPALHS